MCISVCVCVLYRKRLLAAKTNESKVFRVAFAIFLWFILLLFFFLLCLQYFFVGSFLYLSLN